MVNPQNRRDAENSPPELTLTNKALKAYILPPEREA